MSSLYNISADLELILDTIEENGGEVTDDMLNFLEITEEQLKDKLNGYYKYILNQEGDVTTIKEEVKRLTARRKAKENKIVRLKNTMLDAVTKFGTPNKNGSHFIELATCKIATRGSDSIVENEHRVSDLVEEIIKYMEEMYNNGVLVLSEGVDIVGMLSVINANLKAEYDAMNAQVDIVTGEVVDDGESDYVPYTMDDLDTIEIEVTHKTNLTNLMSSEASPIVNIFNYRNEYDVRRATMKSEYSNAIKLGKDITTAKFNRNYTLNIR